MIYNRCNMAIKKVMVSLDETLVSDMDNLVKAGFYKNRSALVHNALMGIQPLKALAEDRFQKIMDDCKPIMNRVAQL